MKRCITKTVGLIAFGISTSLIADGQSLIQTEKQKFSYTIGYQIGGQLVEQMKSGSMDIDQETFVQAIADAVAERRSLLTAKEMEESLRTHQTTEEAKQVAAAESGLLRGKAFRDDYSRNKAVVVTESGLQYRIIEEGMGRSPGPTDTVVVHYIGQLIDGSIFDSSRDPQIGLAQVKVIGVGGGGSNAVNRMYRERVAGVEYLAVNTDAQHLLRLDIPVKIRVGDKLTSGLGVGGDPEIGRGGDGQLPPEVLLLVHENGVGLVGDDLDELLEDAIQLRALRSDLFRPIRLHDGQGRPALDRDGELQAFAVLV